MYNIGIMKQIILINIHIISNTFMLIHLVEALPIPSSEPP